MTDQLSGCELNRAIADRLGYKLYEGNGRYGRFVVMKPPAHEYTAEQWAKFWDMTEAYATPDDAYSSRWLPDWANDAGAALELCLSLLDKLNTPSLADWDLTFMRESVSFQDWSGNFIRNSYSVDGRSAESLARLALMVLRNKKVAGGA